MKSSKKKDWTHGPKYLIFNNTEIRWSFNTLHFPRTPNIYICISVIAHSILNSAITIWTAVITNKQTNKKKWNIPKKEASQASVWRMIARQMKREGERERSQYNIYETTVRLLIACQLYKFMRTLKCALELWCRAKQIVI